MHRRTALITGGAKGIGKRIAIELGKKGMDIIINYRQSEEEATQLAEYLAETYHIRTFTIQGDVTSYKECEKMAELAHQFSPSVDILVHNAGPYIHERKAMIDYTIEEWDYIVNGNLNTVFYLSKLFIPKMRANHWGRIITFGFDRVEGSPGWIYRSAFASAKTGVASLTKTLALEEAKYGITVNMVCPGDIVGKWKEANIDDTLGEEDLSTPVGRPGVGEDIARVVAFLVDEKSSFITGSIVHVNGAKDVLGKINFE